MFHVEQYMKKTALLIITICFLGCNKPNPHPELIDPIYADLQKRFADVKKLADDQKKIVLDFEKQLKEVKPQTGQIKYAEKRYYESKLVLEKLEQLASYYEIRIESRLKFAKSEYLKAWNEKRSWPDPAEFKEYESISNEQHKKMSWNAQDRIKKYREETLDQSSSAKKSSH